MKLKLHTTVRYRNEKCLKGTVIDVKQEDVKEMEKYGEIVEPLPFTPEADLSEEKGVEDKTLVEQKKTPAKRTTVAKKGTTKKK